MDRVTVYLAAVIAVVTIVTGQVLVPPAENRSLRSIPEASALLSLETEALDTAAGALEDASGVRSVGVTFDGWFRADVLGERILTDYLRGDDGWLFYRRALENSCGRAGQHGRVAAAASRLEAVTEAAGIDLVVIVPPDKAAVHPNHVGPFRSEAVCSVQFARSLSAIGPPVVTGFDTVLEVATRSGDNPAFGPLDTHWTFLAAAEASRSVYELAAPQLLDTLELVEVGQRDRVMDLDGLAGRSTTAVEPVWSLRPTGADIASREPLNRSIEVLRSTGDAPERAVLFVRDSFGYHMIESLAHLGTELTVCSCQGGLDARVEAPLARAELLIIESVQRDAIHSLWSKDAAGQLATGLGDRLRGASIEITQDMLQLPDAGLVRFTFAGEPSSVRVVDVETGRAHALSVALGQVGALFVQDVAAGASVRVEVTGGRLTGATAIDLRSQRR
jgi:hypothetical protein